MDLGHVLREMRRRNAVVLYGLADAAAGGADDPDLEAIARTTAVWLSVDFAGIHILDGERQVTLASSDDHSHPPVPESDSICATVLDRGPTEVVEIRNAADDPRLRDNPFVDGTRGHVRFYAATPLLTSGGEPIGTLCVVGDTPRTLTDDERQLLRYLGYAVAHVLEQRRRAPSVHGQARVFQPAADLEGRANA